MLWLGVRNPDQAKENAAAAEAALTDEDLSEIDIGPREKGSAIQS